MQCAVCVVSWSHAMPVCHAVPLVELSSLLAGQTFVSPIKLRRSSVPFTSSANILSGPSLCMQHTNDA